MDARGPRAENGDPALPLPVSSTAARPPQCRRIACEARAPRRAGLHRTARRGAFAWSEFSGLLDLV